MLYSRPPDLSSQDGVRPVEEGHECESPQTTSSTPDTFFCPLRPMRRSEFGVEEISHEAIIKTLHLSLSLNTVGAGNLRLGCRG
jgi:hypothetical protein